MAESYPVESPQRIIELIVRDDLCISDFAKILAEVKDDRLKMSSRLHSLCGSPSDRFRATVVNSYDGPKLFQFGVDSEWSIRCMTSPLKPFDSLRWDERKDDDMKEDLDPSSTPQFLISRLAIHAAHVQGLKNEIVAHESEMDSLAARLCRVVGIEQNGDHVSTSIYHASDPTLIEFSLEETTGKPWYSVEQLERFEDIAWPKDPDQGKE